MHFPHKEGRGRASEYLERVHIAIAGPMPVTSVSGHDYLYVVVDDFTRVVYIYPLHLKSEAVDAFKAVVENKLGRNIRGVLTDKNISL